MSTLDNANGKLNCENRTLFNGDNLEMLRGLDSNSVNLIATDPPFNKGYDFKAAEGSKAEGVKFQDRWSWDNDVHQDWVDQLKDDWPKVYHVIDGSRQSYGDDMGAFLCFMAVRLIEMRRILRADGSIYLHCDMTASHYLKELMDAIFGRENFRNEIIWRYGKMANASKNYVKNYDSILFYTKTDAYTFKVLKGAESEYKERWKKYVRNNKIYYGDVKHKKDKMLQGRIKKVSVNNTIALPDDAVIYDFDKEGKALDNNWYFSIIKGNSKERTSYPTQKPLPIYERIVEASSNPGDVVLDPFCGSGTTPIAAERLGRQWVGMDMSHKLREVFTSRLAQEEISAHVPYKTEPATRTDDGLEAVPFLKPKFKVKEPKGPKMSRDDMIAALHDRDGHGCMGCGFKAPEDDYRFLQLDHNLPRSDGGSNDISNRILLCGPCNMLKSNMFTLSGLRRENKKRGYMKANLPS